MSDASVKPLDGLTAIRFYAAFWVFLFHMDLRLEFHVPGPIRNVIANGGVGMPIFFMLSGLVLGYRYIGRYAGFGDFYVARIARIYPAYLVSALLCMGIARIDPASWLFLLPVDALLLQSWYPNLWHVWHHIGTWSLSVEMFLYASFPLLMGLAKFTTRGLVLTCIGCTLLAASWIPSLRVPQSMDVPFPVFYSIPVYSLPLFVIGVALSQLHHRRVSVRWFGLAPFVLAAFLGAAGSHNARAAALNFAIVPLVAMTLLYAADFQRRGPSRLFFNRITLYLGDISYAFFVYQIPLILWMEAHLQFVRQYPSWLVAGAMLCVNLAAAAFSHRFVEPIGSRAIKQSWRRWSTSRAARPSLPRTDQG